MANNNNIDGTINTTNPQILSAGMSMPLNFTDKREPYKLETLYNYNNNANVIYNNNSYKTVPKSEQPLLLSKIGSNRNDFELRLRDVSRITKYSVSTKGLLFLGKQLLLQGLNSFNETKLYNPLTPIMATVSKASYGLIQPPTRFIEPNLGGVLNATGLSGAASMFGITSKPYTPKGTVGSGALPKNNGYGGKGLIRGKTATDADVSFNQKWGTNGPSPSFLKTVGNFFKSNTAIGTFLPVGQPNGESFKVGEKTAYKTFFDDFSNSSGYFRKGLTPNNYSQKYSAGKTTIADGQSPDKKIYSDGVYAHEKGDVSKNNNDSSDLKNIHTTYQTHESASNFNKSDSIDAGAKEMRDQLKKLLSNIDTKIYDTNTYYNSYIATSYKDLMGVKKQEDTNLSPENYSSDEFKTYAYNVKHSEYKVKTLIEKGMDTNLADKINTLSLMTKDSNNTIVDNTGKTYDPYNDDMIAFYFQDLVNGVYIPFRATVKGIQENSQADWNEVKYINRADRLYSYGGFVRTLNFSFMVAISSITELLPTWTRINYFVGLIKPANYTNKSPVYSRFIVPPLVSFTIGDMYKNQPAVITQIGLNVPDDAIWETLSETHASKNNWSYLINRIIYKNSNNKYAQFPTQCELTVNMILLEKELSHVGGSNYGDHYLTEKYKQAGSSPSGSFSNNLYINNI